jgi:hypothetical protein
MCAFQSMFISNCDDQYSLYQILSGWIVGCLGPARRVKGGRSPAQRTLDAL